MFMKAWYDVYGGELDHKASTENTNDITIRQFIHSVKQMRIKEIESMWLAHHIAEYDMLFLDQQHKSLKA